MKLQIVNRVMLKKVIIDVLILVPLVMYCLFSQYGQTILVSRVKDFLKVCFQPHFRSQFWQVGIFFIKYALHLTCYVIHLELDWLTGPILLLLFGIHLEPYRLHL